MDHKIPNTCLYANLITRDAKKNGTAIIAVMNTIHEIKINARFLAPVSP